MMSHPSDLLASYPELYFLLCNYIVVHVHAHAHVYVHVHKYTNVYMRLYTDNIMTYPSGISYVF